MRITRLTILVGLLSLAVFVGPGVRSAEGAEKAVWGPLTMPDGASALPVYRDLGVDTLQFELDWYGAAPTPPRDPFNPSDPSYRWPQLLDRAVSQGLANGMEVALLVHRSPSWANGGRPPHYAPSPAALAAFVTAASRRYPSVRRWMIWGEPNRDDHFQPSAASGPAGPRAYAVMLDAAYAALKTVSSANLVIGGMTWTGGTIMPAPFLQSMRLPNGRPPRLDWYGHNPFPFRFPNLREEPIVGGWRDISDLDTLGDELRRVYGSRVRLWLSEYTVLSDRSSDQFEMGVSRAEQARWLTAGYELADALPSVAGLGWLGLLDEPGRPGSSNWGLLTAGGARKPSYEAYRLAPSVRFRPAVRLARRITRRALRARGLRVLVRPKVSGSVTVELRTRRGRRVARASRSAAATRIRSLRLRRRSTRRGRYTVIVRAPRAEAVRRALRVR